ncbi:dihydroorotate dehydrogenase electron transfer subunit [uncultured Clostridium sp.]|uniref:dihydroorotate dehydrogenase electron transfer subunit n=1 Tax=uncultured Clostridium sp. TaxID=59620 RepID=UPI002638469B|nr:dihydroorotate dehydrogenase electron transfer subunit [uncultured Clostridium sp.]
MAMEFVNTIVTENKEISNGIFSMKVKHKSGVKAGQFYMLKGELAFLGRPISVCEVEDDIIRFVYAVVGIGTKELEKMKVGSELKLIGPLGNGFDTQKEYGRVAIVGGGIGVAPMLELAKQLKLNGIEKADFYGGFREDVYLTDEISNYVNETFIATNSGKHGEKGFVTDPLLRNIKQYDTVLCCGPEVMMKRVVEICKENSVNVYISMEKHMACGVGACLVCTCKTKSGNKRVCKDGPVFNGLDVEF